MPHDTLRHSAQFTRYRREGLWGDKLIVDHVDDQARRRPQKAAIVEAARTLTYADVVAASRGVAAALLHLGVRHGDVVAVQAPNWAELPIVHLATDRIGAIFLPLSEGFGEKELQHLLRLSAPRVVFCAATLRGKDHLGFMRGLAARVPCAPRVIAMRAGRTAGGLETFDDLAQWDGWDAEALAAARGTADAPSHVMVSSGSTGLPKVSMFSDNNTLVKLIQQYERASHVTSDDVAAALAPAGTGSTGYNYPILAMLLHGGTSVLLEHWSGSNIAAALDLVERHHCTIVVAVPAQLAMLVNALDASGRRAPAVRLITNAGAKLSPSVAEAAERHFSCKVQSIYGTSEAGATAMTCVDDPDDKRRHTAGRPLAGQEVRLVDDRGAEVPHGEVGEVTWRGANKSYGFLNDPEGTARVWDDEGWLSSGDLGKLDAEGYLHIVGRKKDMIIRGGQNIHPGAIEEALLRHPAVAEVAVVPLPDPVMGERIGACVVARPGPRPTLDSLKSCVLAAGLAAWNQPEFLLDLPELPRNAGGKVDKKRLATSAATTTWRQL